MSRASTGPAPFFEGELSKLQTQTPDAFNLSNDLACRNQPDGGDEDASLIAGGSQPKTAN